MNRKQLLLILLFLSFGSIIKAQQYTTHKIIHIGYVYQNQSFGEIGGKFYFLKTDDLIYRVGGSAMMGSVNSKFAIIPKLQGDVLINFEKNVDFNHSYYFLAGAEVTTKYFAPKVGVTLFGIVDLTGGYAFSLGKNGVNGKELKGLNINFTLNLPIPFINDYIK